MNHKRATIIGLLRLLCVGVVNQHNYVRFSLTRHVSPMGKTQLGVLIYFVHSLPFIMRLFYAKIIEAADE